MQQMSLLDLIPDAPAYDGPYVKYVRYCKRCRQKGCYPDCDKCRRRTYRYKSERECLFGKLPAYKRKPDEMEMCLRGVEGEPVILTGDIREAQYLLQAAGLGNEVPLWNESKAAHTVR